MVELVHQLEKDQELMLLVKQFFNEGLGNYGSKSIKDRMKQVGNNISRRRVIKLMREANVICKTKSKFKATTDSRHDKPIAPNLLDRNFTVDSPNTYWAGDITYIATEEGWLYSAIVIDLYSRKIVGWSMSNRMTADLVNKALLMAIWQKKPRKGLIWHSDRGSQYASDSHL